MYLLTKGEDMPCWYDLSWQKKGPMGIIFKLHRDFIKEATGKMPVLYIDELMKEFEFGCFGKPFSKQFGFENIFQKLGEDKNFISYLVKIPRIKNYLYEPCPRCSLIDPNQIDLFYPLPDCTICKNKGKIKKKDERGKYDYTMNWQRAFEISASLTIFFSMAKHFAFENKTSAKIPQLLMVQTMTKSGMHGSSLWGEYGKSMHKYLSSFKPNTSIDEMSDAMLLTYQRMVGLGYFDRHSFRSTITDENGWLNVDVLGNACGLNPSDGSLSTDRETAGYQFSCHNTDTPIQQISLIAGLAALNNKARREINKI